MASSKPFNISGKLYENCLSSFFDLYHRHQLKFSASRDGLIAGIRIEIDDASLREVLATSDIRNSDFFRVLQVINNIINAIFQGEEEELKDWLESARPFVCDNIDSMINLTKLHLGRYPKLKESYYFFITTLSNILVSVDSRIHIIHARDNGQRIPSARLLINYMQSYCEDDKKSTLELDVCSADIDYIIDVLTKIRNDLTEVTKV